MPHHDSDVDDSDGDDDHNAFDHEHADHHNSDHCDDDNQKRFALQGFFRGEQNCEWQSVGVVGAACNRALLGDTVSFAFVMRFVIAVIQMQVSEHASFQPCYSFECSSWSQERSMRDA